MTNLKRSYFQAQPFHLVSPSPWPFYTSISLLTLTCSGVLTMHSFSNAKYFLFLALATLILCIILWWRDVISEGTYLGNHNIAVEGGLNIRLAIGNVRPFLLCLLFIFALFLLYLLLSFLDLSLIPIAHACSPDSGENSSTDESSSLGVETDMEYLARIADEYATDAVNKDYTPYNEDRPVTETRKIDIVYSYFLNALIDCVDLNLDERNEALVTLKDALVAKGFDQDLVNQVVPMDPPAAADVTSSSNSDSDSIPGSEENTLNSNPNAEQAPDSEKSNSEKGDKTEPSNKRRRIE